MARILSIDLAYKSYGDFGFCMIEESGGKVAGIQYLSYEAIGLEGAPLAGIFAQNVLHFCLDHGVSILMLDGPQGWKDPDNGLQHQRVCEKQLNTQSKTGTVGKVKPANFTSFVYFAIDVFGVLYNTDRVSLVTQPKIAIPDKRILLIETYPYSAWRSLNILPLLGKKNCSLEQIAHNVQELRRTFHLPETENTNHDELSALVAGFAGVAIAAGNSSGYVALGVPPKLMSQGYLVEGYIVNPKYVGEKSNENLQ